jgi:acyl-CoA thioesterase I
MKKFLIQALVVLLIFLIGPKEVLAQMARPIRYVALGDSYTIGTGVAPHQAWPQLLADHLSDEGIVTTLAANLARNGWTSEQVIQFQLPMMEAARPDFVTLLIGVNDWVQGVDTVTFRRNIQSILDNIIPKIHRSDYCIVLTIPDFSVTPVGEQFRHRGDIRTGLQEFNAILIEEARARNLKIVDLFSLSQNMADDPQWVALDGLHPSKEAHRQWEEKIFPVAFEILTMKKD